MIVFVTNGGPRVKTDRRYGEVVAGGRGVEELHLLRAQCVIVELELVHPPTQIASGTQRHVHKSRVWGNLRSGGYGGHSLVSLAPVWACACLCVLDRASR